MAEPQKPIRDILRDFGTSLAADLLVKNIQKPREVLAAPGTSQAIADALALDTDYDNEIKALEDRVRKKRKAMRSWGAKLRYAADPDLKEETEKNVAAMEAQIVELKRLKVLHKTTSIELGHQERSAAIRLKIEEMYRVNPAQRLQAIIQTTIDTINTQISVLQTERSALVQDPNYATDPLLQARVNAIDQAISQHFIKIDQLIDGLSGNS